MSASRSSTELAFVASRSWRARRTHPGAPAIDVFTTVHQMLGYVVALVVLTAGVVGLVQAREARDFVARVYVAPALVLDLQVLGGLVIYTVGGYWAAESILLRVVHPILAVLGVVVTHAGLKRSRRQQTNAAGHRTVAGGLFLGLLAVLLAIAAASAGVRGV